MGIRFKDPAHFASLLSGGRPPKPLGPRANWDRYVYRQWRERPPAHYCMFCNDVSDEDLSLYGGCGVCGNNGYFRPKPHVCGDAMRAGAA